MQRLGAACPDVAQVGHVHLAGGLRPAQELVLLRVAGEGVQTEHQHHPDRGRQSGHHGILMPGHELGQGAGATAFGTRHRSVRFGDLRLRIWNRVNLPTVPAAVTDTLRVAPPLSSLRSRRRMRRGAADRRAP